MSTIELTVKEAVTFRDIYENIAIRLQRNKTHKMQRKLAEQIKLLRKILENLSKKEDLTSVEGANE